MIFVETTQSSDKSSNRLMISKDLESWSKTTPRKGLRTVPIYLEQKSQSSDFSYLSEVT